ncbi:hypothetical protein RFI_09284, partial [Reticulomyxa filosa]
PLRVYNRLPDVIDTHALGRLCPLRESVFIRNNSFYVTRNEDQWNVTIHTGICLHLFGVCGYSNSGPYPYPRYFDEAFVGEYDPSIESKCSGGIEHYDSAPVIVVRSVFPQMLFEVFVRVVLPLFEMTHLGQILNDDFHLVLLYLWDFHFLPFHHMLLQPFTKHPILRVQDLLRFHRRALFTNATAATQLKAVKPDQCFSIKQLYLCGLRLTPTQSQDLQTIPWMPSYHRFKEPVTEWLKHAWDVSRWYKQLYYTKYGLPPVFNPFLHKVAKVRPKVVFVRRAGLRRWQNVTQTVEECKRDPVFIDNMALDCELIDFTHLNAPQLLYQLSTADVLVGMHGSCLVNGIFMNDFASVLEILPHAGRPWHIGYEEGSLMRWVYRFVPQRHAMIQLKKEDYLWDGYWSKWQFPFTLSWQRLKPYVLYLLKNKHNFCKEDSDLAHLGNDTATIFQTYAQWKLRHPEIADMKVFTHKAWLNSSFWYPYRPTCQL